MTYSIQAESLHAAYGSLPVLQEVSFTISEGEFFIVIGPNGSGKTTTLRMIMNILIPDSGSIRVFGEPINESATDRIGYLPEERGLYKNMTLRDVIRFYGELKSKKISNAQIDQWLQVLDLEDWGKKKVRALSKGMSQKVQFIATIVSEPDLVILDEPFTGLDPVNTDVMREEILKLRDSGATVIFSTHDMSIAEKMCDYIFMIFKGNKVLDGTLTEIQDKYGDDTLRVRTEAGMAAMTDLQGVTKVEDYGQIQELRLTQDRDYHDVLSEIMTRTRIKSFELAKPSLHNIFVRIAGPEAEEATSE